MGSRRSLAKSGALLVGLLVAVRTGGEDPRTIAAREQLSPAVRRSVARGLEWLVRCQARLGTGDFDAEVPVAANALGGLALLASGTTEVSGPPEHVRALRRATRALLRYQTKGGYFDDAASVMYGHGFATLFLAELYGTSHVRSRELRDALRRAIEVIERSQSAEGGWDYFPHEDFGGQAKLGSDSSISVCQTMALRSARNLGLRVDTGVVGLARTYILGAQNADGGFRYRRLTDYLSSRSAFARSAAGICILYSLYVPGDTTSDAIRRGFDYLEREYRSAKLDFPYYGHYYCAQAMYQAGGKFWSDYFEFVSERLIDSQREDGGWRAGQRENDAQATAMALIILQLPNGFLPIHER